MTTSLLVSSVSSRALAACLAFLTLHAALVTLVLHHHAEIVSVCIQEGLIVAATVAALRRARDASPSLRPGWIFIVLAFLAWAIGDAASTWIDLTGRAPTLAAGVPDFLFFFYGAALMLAVTWSDEVTLGRLAFVFDAAQAALASFLVYIAIFNVLPFSAEPPHPIGSQLLIAIYDAENACFALLAAARLLGRTPLPARWHYDRVTVIFTATYAVVAALYNHLSDQPGLANILVDVPFLLFIVTVRCPARPAGAPQPRRTVVALLVDSAGPTAFTLAVLVFGAIVASQHLVLGVGAVASTLLLYGLRAALLQARMLGVQLALAEARDRLERLSLEDGLTRIANRRHFDAVLADRWSDAARTGLPLSLLLLDVDHFKALNDRQGHQAGDACLQRIAACLTASLSHGGALVARFGGEEFAIILPGANLEAAGRAAEHVRAGVASLAIANDERRTVTVSVGVASTAQRAWSEVGGLVAAADRALYHAKQSGRDRVTLACASAQPEPPQPGSGQPGSAASDNSGLHPVLAWSDLQSA